MLQIYPWKRHSFYLSIHGRNNSRDPQASAPSTAIAAPDAKTEPKVVARAVLRTVRRSINEFRDKAWDGLIVERNRVLATMFCTGVMVFGLLAIAIIPNPPPSAIVAASIFYLVGAAIGLWGRLRSELQTEIGAEDYGLTAARLITTPLFSGLAAIFGVVLVALLPYVNTVFGPTHPSLTITSTSPLPGGTVGEKYNQLLAASGTSPYSWKITRGAAPDGLDLGEETGVLSGTPTKAESRLPSRSPTVPVLRR